MTSSESETDPDTAPSGLPNEEREEEPLGPSEPNPNSDEVPDEGPGAQPGIPTDGEPPASG